jgi:carboxyl-terminal processing protease
MGRLRNPELHSTRPQAEALQDRGRVSLPQIVFLLGTFFGMGLMLVILELWGLGEDEDLAHYRQVRDLVTNTYVRDVDKQDLLEDALRGMLNGLDDYSDYYVREEFDAVNRDTSGEMIGIGVILRYKDVPQVLFPLENSPAMDAGIQVGDEILAIDGVSTAGLLTEELSSRIQGEPGSSILLQVRGLDGQEREHEITRRELPIPSVRRVRMIDEQRGIGYLAITSFSNRTTEEFDEAVSRLQDDGLKALILDLRGNQGGLLSPAVEISQRFVREGVLASTRGRGEPKVESAAPELAWYHGIPLILLVDGESASASEVLAGALQDHRVAVLLGEPTYGKGVVQTISRYPDRHAIAKLTTSYYFTPSHRNLQRGTDGHDYGLLPNFLVDCEGEEREAIYGYLHNSFEPPPTIIADLREWQSESGLELVNEPPLDPQLEAAVAIFRGEHQD